MVILSHEKVRRAALKHLLLVLRRDKDRLAELVLEGREVDPVVSGLLKGLLKLSTGVWKGMGATKDSWGTAKCGDYAPSQV